MAETRLGQNEMLLRVAKAICAEDRWTEGTLIPDKYDNLRSWARETDEQMERRAERKYETLPAKRRRAAKSAFLETQRENRDYIRDEIEKYDRMARAAIGALAEPKHVVEAPTP